MFPSFIQLLFYLFATVAVLSAIVVISTRNPVHSVLSLVITFFAMSGIWMILRAEFLSLILLLVYVGAVMTLFLFVVMMLSIHQETKLSGLIRYWPFALIIALLTTGLIITTLESSSLGTTQLPLIESNNNLHAIAHVLYTDYIYLFEIAGVILLAAMIAAITLTHRGPLERKVQNPSQQISVRPEDRIRLIKMPSTPRSRE